MSLKEQLLAISAMAKATQAMAEGIIAALEAPKGREAAPAAAETVDCSHPEDRRISVGSMGSPEAWICGVCQHQGGET